ncbi:MAG: 50S ribosomal protein L10 [Proteobacteria bacterium]|nr:50S ribosomal protein L10 [Pseudomonadota bacterium]
MDRAEKQAFIQSLNGELSKAGVVIVTRYSGLDVATITKLRTQMRAAGARFRVTKNRLTKRALEGTPYSGIADMFKGPTAIAFSDDVVAPAKVAVEFAKEFESLIVVGGAMGETRLDAAGVKALATLPSLDELRAKIVGLVQAPAQKVASVVQAPAGKLARVIGAYAAKEQA